MSFPNTAIKTSQSIPDRVKEYLTKVDCELDQYQYAKDAERLTGVRKSYLAAGVVGVFTVMIFFNIAGQLLSHTISWVYPAYASFKAIESPSPEDDKQWLTYWTVVGFVHMIEYFSDILLFWFPFYYLFKTAFILWLTLPRFRGAEIIYSRFLRPQLIRYENKIDDKTNHIKDKVRDAAKDFLDTKND
ncbi:unnamed protein product [Cunninghamella blakesleeana]